MAYPACIQINISRYLYMINTHSSLFSAYRRQLLYPACMVILRNEQIISNKNSRCFQAKNIRICYGIHLPESHEAQQVFCSGVWSR